MSRPISTKILFCSLIVVYQVVDQGLNIGSRLKAAHPSSNPKLGIGTKWQWVLGCAKYSSFV